jgi:NarL family two-component system response regulator LiaR
MTPQPVRVLIVDDHDIVRKGLRALLETDPMIEVVGEAGDGAQAIELATELCPHVILMDLVMPGVDGIEAMQEIRTRGVESQILVLTSFSGADKLFPAVRAGALGYLLKDTSPDELVLAIQQAADGHAPLNPLVARRLLREFSHEGAFARPVEPLTNREVEVLRILAHGQTNEQIAAKLFISEATVRTHVSNILGKLGVENRTQAALYALRVGLASLDDL